MDGMAEETRVETWTGPRSAWRQARHTLTWSDHPWTSLRLITIGRMNQHSSLADTGIVRECNYMLAPFPDTIDTLWKKRWA